MYRNLNIKSIGVFCGARLGNDEKFKNLATECGKRIAEEKLRLVYGGGDSGLMGVVSRSAKDAGANVLGISTKIVSEREMAEFASGHTYITNTMYQRKIDLFSNSDAFICLPGGFGTLDEMFEIITLRFLSENEKPIIIINHDKYWDPLLDLIDHIISHEFAGPEICDHYRIANSVDEAFNFLGFKK